MRKRVRPKGVGRWEPRAIRSEDSLWAEEDMIEMYREVEVNLYTIVNWYKKLLLRSVIGLVISELASSASQSCRVPLVVRSQNRFGYPAGRRNHALPSTNAIKKGTSNHRPH